MRFAVAAGLRGKLYPTDEFSKAVLIVSHHLNSGIGTIAMLTN